MLRCLLVVIVFVGVKSICFCVLEADAVEFATTIAAIVYLNA